MSTDASPLSVWILDPANLTPFYSLALGKALVSQGQRVRFVTSKFLYDPNLAIPSGIELDLHYFRAAERYDRIGAWPRRIYRAWRYPRDHRRLLRRIEFGQIENPDVIHIQWSRLPRFDRRLVQRLKSMGIRVVHTVHDVEPLYKGAAGMSSLGLVYAECDALIVHTHANKIELVGRYPSLNPDRIHVIPHGPLQADDGPRDGTKTHARSELGIPPTGRVALNFGSIKDYKGIDLLIAAMPAVAKRVPDAFLLLAGRPATPADVPDLSLLRQARIGFRADFDFIPDKDAWKYYVAADVVVLPYRRITQSGVLLSAMAFGRPSIVSNVGGLPEVVRAGETGWIVPAEDLEALTAALVDALADPARLERMGRQARRDAESRFSWDAIGQATTSLYRSL